MRERFAEKETHSLVFKLDFKYFYDRTAKVMGENKISWWDIENWLWEKHKIFLRTEETTNRGWFECDTFCIANDRTEVINTSATNSPITARIEGIEQAVKLLSEG